MNFFESKSNKRVTIICVLTALLSAFFMQDDSIVRLTKSNQLSVIGSFKQFEKDVRRKNIASYFWDELKANDNLAEGDSIFTGDKSSVTIELSSGQIINIAPNSLVKFSMKSNKLMLDVPYGSMQLLNDVEEILVSDCGKGINIAETTEAVDVKKSERCGTIQLNSKSGKIAKRLTAKERNSDISQALDKAVEVLKFDVDRTVALSEEPAFTEIAPQFENLNIDYVASEEKPQILKWKAIENADDYQIEISDTPEFIHVDKYTSKNPELKLEKLMPRMYFRAKAIAKNLESTRLSEVGKLNVTFPPIKIAENKIIKNYNAKNPKDNGLKGSFKVSWTKVPFAEKYVVEVKDISKNTKINEFKSRKPAQVLEVPSIGKYSYQVHALDSRGRKISSSDIGQVLYNKIFSLLAPIIKEGANDKFFFFQGDSAKYVWLNWFPQGEERKFRVEIANDKAFSNVIKSVFTTKLKFLITDQVQTGDYYWRVRTEDKDEFSNWSNIEVFRVKISKK